MASKNFTILCLIFLMSLSIFTSNVMAVSPKCEEESKEGNCANDKHKALSLKVIAIVSILVTSIIGVCLPLVTRCVKAFSPQKNLFLIVKAFSAGIILGTGFMHVLPDSFEMLSSSCLPDFPWHVFPFSGLLAMFSAIVTMMIDSIATSVTNNKKGLHVAAINANGDEEKAGDDKLEYEKSLSRYRVIAMVLELGIIVHSIVIGLSLGVSNNPCTIKGLVAALCFHQMFEGMGLGGCILQADYKFIKKAIMVFFFAVTTPAGIAVGILLSNSYKENSPKALVTTGLLNASSAGLLIYMALVDLLAADFMGPKLQGSIKLQLKSYVAVFLGACGMSVLAIWA
ncbi:hypothetical protein Leryth_010442 [Lithospermum erythrorhizon]|nr:hypothetical protein Leryth_010442 [Lithospermum erythrorhizon]